MARRLAIVSAVFALGWAGAALAEPYTYTVRGDALVRTKASGQIIEARDLSAGPDSPWRKVFEIAPGDPPSRKLLCDPTSAAHCYISTAENGSDRLEWWPVNLLAPMPANVSALFTDQPIDIQDIDAASGEILFIARPSSAPKPGDTPAGYYLLKGQQAMRLSPLPADPSSINRLAFLRTPSGPPDILVMSGVPGTIAVVNGDLSASQPAPQPGTVRAIDGHSVLLSAQSASTLALDLDRLSFPSREPGPWSSRVVYAASGGRPSLAFLPAPDQFPGDVAALRSGRVFAVVDDGAGPRLMSVCGRGGGSESAQAAYPFAAQLAGAAALAILSHGGDYALVTVRDASGAPSYWLLSDPSKGGAEDASRCNDSASLQPLPSDDPSPPLALAVDRRSVVADDGETIPYTVVGLRDAKGPTLIRVYGGAGLPVFPGAQTPFELEWLRRGGRLALPVLRGDAKLPWWKKPASQPDYQDRAARDGLLVAQDLIAHKLAEPGQIRLLGISLGAFTAAKMTLTRPDLFYAAVLASGALDLTVEVGHATAAQGIGPAEGGFERWFGAAKASGACANPRFLIIAGGADALAPAQGSLNFAGYIKGLGYRGGLEILEKADHQMMGLDKLPEVIFKDLDDVAQARKACGAAP